MRLSSSHERRIVIPPYTQESKRKPLVVRRLSAAAGYLTENGTVTMMLLVISCGLLSAAVPSNVYGPPAFAWFYVPVYAICGPFVAWVLLTVLNYYVAPLWENLGRMRRRGDTSEFDEDTYKRVLASLRSIGVPHARKVLHKNRDNALSYTMVYPHALSAARSRGMDKAEAAHYAHHLAMLTYPGAAEAELGNRLIAMIEDRGLVTDPDLITEVLTADVSPLTSGQL